MTHMSQADSPQTADSPLRSHRPTEAQKVAVGDKRQNHQHVFQCRHIHDGGSATGLSDDQGYKEMRILDK
jgi:hypothetical protein